MRGRNQHYLPAVLIGGFGRPAGTRLRDAQVAVRRKPGGAVDTDFPAAETLAFRRDGYRLSSPLAGVDPDFVDRLWDPVETRLRELVGRLNDRRLQPEDDEWLFTYAAQAGVRHPSFEDVAADYQGGRARLPCRATTCSGRVGTHPLTSFPNCGDGGGGCCTTRWTRPGS